jgi:transposase-like protein/Zn ribbon nucleic-acid-binding protein
MEDYPKTILEFEARFATDQACREYLASLRWPEGFHCPACDHAKAWWTGRGVLHCARCGHQTSVTAGTVFQDTHKPLRLWFRAMWYVTSQKYGVSALGLQRVLGLGSYHTAWVWLHKLRRAMVRPGRDRLAGTVEVDEVYVGGAQPGRHGRGAAGKAIVVVAAEEDGAGIGRIRLLRVANAGGPSVCDAVQQCVVPGSLVHTDGLTSYNGLAALGYQHEVIHKGSIEVGDNPLPRVHRVASLLKRWMLGTHQGAIQPSYLDYYLDEYTFRFNRRTSRSRGKLFYRLAQQAVAIDPVTESRIRGGKQPE